MRTTVIAMVMILGLATGPALGAQWEGGPSVQDVLRAAGANSREMTDVACRVLTTSQGAPIGLASKTFSGTLKSAPGQMGALQDVSGQSLNLADGPVTLVYGMPSMAGFFTRQRIVALTQNGRSAVFPTSSDRFRSFGDFTTLIEPGQKAMLRGSEAETVMGRQERESTEYCTYSGYCYAHGLDSKGGYSYHYGFHISCNGRRPVRELVTTYQTVKTVAILTLPGQAMMGAITGAAEVREREETLEVLGPCQ